MQNVYVGSVRARRGEQFVFIFEPVPDNLSGFSGAPILDEHGYVVGVLRGGARAKIGGYLMAIGQDVGEISRVLGADKALEQDVGKVVH